MGKASREKQKRRELQDIFAPFKASHARAREVLIAKNFVPRYPEPAIPQIVGVSVAAMEEVIAAGLRNLDPKPTPEGLVRFAEETTVIHDRYADIALYLYRDINPAPPACKAGCHWCCFVRVSIGIEEAYRLKLTLDTMEPDRRQRILDRLNKHKTETDKGDPEVLARTPRLCPMNEDGSCQVYGTRAVMCRNHIAYDVNPCRSWVEGNLEGMGRINGFMQEFGRYVTLGENQVMEHYGIDSRAFELADALTYLWENAADIDKIVAGDRSVTDKIYRTDLEEAHANFLRRTAEKAQLRVKQ